MVELDYEAKKSGLSFSAKVKLLASEAPDPFSAVTLHRAANCLDSHFGFSPREKKKAIVKFIKNSGGTASYSEIQEYFKWKRDVIFALAAELEADGMIEFYAAEPAGSGSGRKTRRMRLVDTAG